jgi:hypothetical protein
MSSPLRAARPASLAASSAPCPSSARVTWCTARRAKRPGQATGLQTAIQATYQQVYDAAVARQTALQQTLGRKLPIVATAT